MSKKDLAGHLSPARHRPDRGPRPGQLHRAAHDGRRTRHGPGPRTASSWPSAGTPARLPIPGADLALTYEDIPSLTSLPGRVAVIGGADTGCQIASIFDDFGAAVTLFEAGPILVPAADHDVSAELAAPSAPRA